MAKEVKREIKFRAWDKEKKEMWNDVWVNGGAVKLVTGQGSLTFIHMIPMQFTGLKDKNGKEIYEGDIVRVGEMEDLGNDTDATIHKVKWFGDEGYPSFDFEGWGGEVNGMSEVSQGIDYYCEVIGNIYENPDLITNN